VLTNKGCCRCDRIRLLQDFTEPNLNFCFQFAERLAGRLSWSVQEESETMREEESRMFLIVQYAFAMSKQYP